MFHPEKGNSNWMYSVPGNSILPSDSNVHKHGSDIKEPEGQVFLWATGQSPHRGHRGPVGKKRGREKKETLIYTIISPKKTCCLPHIPLNKSNGSQVLPWSFHLPLPLPLPKAAWPRANISQFSKFLPPKNPLKAEDRSILSLEG